MTTMRVVLDLAELQRLSTTYQQAGDRVLTARRTVQDIAAELGAALRALPDPAIATAIAATFGYVTDPQYGLDRDARLMDELSSYLADVRRLAEEADADHDGTWSQAEVRAFVAKHPNLDGDPALRAVLEALAGGTIYRSGKDIETPREEKIDKLLALAGTQHVHETGTNLTKYGEWFGNNGQEWCADFVSWVFAHSGNPLPAIQGPHGFAYCPYAITYAREHGQLHETPHRGDIFLVRDGSHTGIVSKVYPDGTFDTVEGNHADEVAHVHRNSHDGSYYFWTAIR
jgi:hypothetical protein